MAKSKLARRVRKIRNLKGAEFCVKVHSQAHCDALFKAFRNARIPLDRGPVWLAYKYHVLSKTSGAYVLCHGYTHDSVGIYNHTGGFPCIKL